MLAPQDGHLMSQGGSSSSEARLRTRNSKIERAQRIVSITVTVRPARENLQSFSALWKFEQGQDTLPHEKIADKVFEHNIYPEYMALTAEAEKQIRLLIE